MRAAFLLPTSDRRKNREKPNDGRAIAVAAESMTVPEMKAIETTDTIPGKTKGGNSHLHTADVDRIVSERLGAERRPPMPLPKQCRGEKRSAEE